MAHEISFTVEPSESKIIDMIATRARAEFGIDKADVAMDVTATHANGCPLDLAGLLAAEPFDFAHDLGGIARHLNRETGYLAGYFIPRYARRRETPDDLRGNPTGG